MDQNNNKIQDVSQDEEIIKKQDVALDTKRPVYIRTLNVFTSPMKNRYERHYREKKHHLVIDLLFIIIILLLVATNIILFYKKFEIADSNLPAHSSKINKPYLETNFTVNKTGTLPANLGDELEYVLSVKNITSEDVKDLIVQVNLTGSTIDRDTLKTKAVIKDEILEWTSYQNESLSLLEKNSQINLDFKFKLERSLNINNPSIITSALIQGYINDEDFKHQTEEFQIKINSDLSVEPSYSYFSQEGEQLGIGVWPPQVGEKTSLRIFLDIENNLNNIKDVAVTALLPAGVEWTGNSAVNTGQAITFNENIKKIIWPVGELDTLGGASANFELEFTPQETGQNIELLDKIKVTGTDLFTGDNLIFEIKNLTTQEKVGY